MWWIATNQNTAELTSDYLSGLDVKSLTMPLSNIALYDSLELIWLITLQQWNHCIFSCTLLILHSKLFLDPPVDCNCLLYNTAMAVWEATPFPVLYCFIPFSNLGESYVADAFQNILYCASSSFDLQVTISWMDGCTCLHQLSGSSSFVLENQSPHLPEGILCRGSFWLQIRPGESQSIVAEFVFQIQMQNNKLLSKASVKDHRRHSLGLASKKRKAYFCWAEFFKRQWE